MLLSLAHFRWLNLEQVWQNAKGAFRLIVLAQVAHLVFFVGRIERPAELLKNSETSLASRVARGKAFLWHWSQSQSTPRLARSRY